MNDSVKSRKAEGLVTLPSLAWLLLFFAVGGALIYGYVTNKMISRYNPMTIVTYQFSFGALLFLPFFLLFGLKGLTPEFFSMPVQSKIMALAVLCSCVCFGLWAFCTGKLGVIGGAAGQVDRQGTEFPLRQCR